MPRALAFVLLGLFPTALPPLGATVPWTLEDAVAAALANSPDATVARQRLAGAEAVLQEARATGYPHVLLQGRYTRSDSPLAAFGSILNQRAFDDSLDFNHPGTIDNLNATGTVVFNLYSGGRRAAAVEGARAGALAAEQDANATRLGLAAGVVRSYFEIRKSHEAQEAVAAGVKAYEAAVAAARARFDAGELLKADLLSLEVELARTREELITARHARALAERAFLFVLGLEASSEPVDLVDDDPTIGRIGMPADFDFTRRPDLLGLQERVRAAEAAVRAARGARQPTVNAFASYQYDHGWTLDRGSDSWAAGLSVDVNVFDGGALSARVRQAQAGLEVAKAMLRKATLAIALEVQRAKLGHEQALERVSVTGSAVEQAGESAELSRARFAGGALLTADLIGVETRLIEARMRRAVAEADERIALAELRQALGLSPFNHLPVIPTSP